MSTKWVVTAAAERMVLSQGRTGETTFTVTNPSEAADRAVFDPVTDDGADAGWFTVDDPQRLVRGGASVSYLLKVAVPTDTPPGGYAVQGRVYSADSAPEESSVLSPRVLLEVPAEPEPERRNLPWWIWLVAGGLALVLLIVLGVLVFGGGGGEDEDQTGGPVPASPGADVTMPDLLGMSERDALRTLRELGLTDRARYRHDPERADQVIQQSIEPDRPVNPEAVVVQLEVAIALAPPAVTAPAGVPLLETPEPPTLEWDAGTAPTQEWQISWSRERCRFDPRPFVPFVSDLTGCQFPESDGSGSTDTTSFTPSLSFPNREVSAGGGTVHTGWVRWQVAALDDFGTPGPASEPAYFRVPVQP